MKLYIYEHCPFCVIAKMIFALKDHPVNVETLLYNDVQTPMQMIGRKMLPVLEYQPGLYMPESLDIVQYIDNEKDTPKITQPTQETIAHWVNTVERFIYRLAYPRWVRAPFAEFSTDEARDYFHKSKDPSGRGFVSDLADPALTRRAQMALDALEVLLKDYPLLDKDRALAFEDFTLFAQLHSLSIVKGLNYGPQVELWRQTASEACSIPLHDCYAN